jgi:hypothetical protein
MTPSTDNLDEVKLRSMTPGTQLDVETKNTHYRIECLGGEAMRISGHPRLCPTPVPAELEGSQDRGGAIQWGDIKCGKHLLFLLEKYGPVRTTKIVGVHLNPPGANSN